MVKGLGIPERIEDMDDPLETIRRLLAGGEELLAVNGDELQAAIELLCSIEDARRVAEMELTIDLDPIPPVRDGEVVLYGFDGQVDLAGTFTLSGVTVPVQLTVRETAPEQFLVTGYLAQGGRLFASGAEIAWDLDAQGNVGVSLGINGQKTLYHVLIDGVRPEDAAVPVLSDRPPAWRFCSPSAGRVQAGEYLAFRSLTMSPRTSAPSIFVA